MEDLLTQKHCHLAVLPHFSTKAVLNSIPTSLKKKMLPLSLMDMMKRLQVHVFMFTILSSSRQTNKL